MISGTSHDAAGTAAPGRGAGTPPVSGGGVRHPVVSVLRVLRVLR